MNSIRRRLLLSLLIGLLASSAMMIVVVYTDTIDELHELFVGNLHRMAIVIGGQAFSPTPSQEIPADIDVGELEESYIIQIWDGNGTLLRSSRPDIALPLHRQEGLNHIVYDDQPWEIYTLKARDDGYIQIAQPQEIVTTMIGESALRALLPFVLFLILMAAGGWVAVGRSLLPLNRLSETISGWDADKMQPMKIADAPQEIQPIANALNSMLSKLDKSMSIQRQFTADAAHELRTPLTAIKLQLDNLVRARSETDQKEAIRKLSEGIDRCIHLASQLLSASRSMAIRTSQEFQIVNLNELVRSSVGDFAIIASSKHIEIAFENGDECCICGNEESLRVLINNLVDNAVRYTSTQGEIIVRVQKVMERAIVEVSDNGPGIPEREHENIFRRFYRIPGSASTGSGLGLSIVKSVAETHNARVVVTNGLHQKGTTIRIAFPAQIK